MKGDHMRSLALLAATLLATPYVGAANAFNHCVPVELRYMQSDKDSFLRDFEISVFQMRADRKTATETVLSNDAGFYSSVLGRGFAASDPEPAPSGETDLGTGFLVADNLALTALHVVTTDDRQDQTHIAYMFPPHPPVRWHCEDHCQKRRFGCGHNRVVTRESPHKLLGLPVRLKSFCEID